jgi:DNA primase
VLYNLHRAKKSVRQREYTILVEGYMDVIGLHGVGVTEVVASCGTALTSQQVRMMYRHAPNIVVNFDPDAAGAAAAERSIQMLLEEGMHIRVLSLPGDSDPDEFVNEHGREAYRELLKKSPRYFEWLSDRARQRFDVKSAEGRVAAFKFLLPAIQRLPDKIERAAVANDVASQLGVDTGLVLDQFKKLATERGQAPLKAPKVDLPANERLLLRCLLESDEARREVLPLWQDREWQAAPETHRIMSALVAVGEDFQYDLIESRLGEGDRTLLASLVFADGENKHGEEHETAFEQVAAQARDCLRMMEAANVQAEVTQLKMKVAAAEREGNVMEALRLSEQLKSIESVNRRRRRPIVE